MKTSLLEKFILTPNDFHKVREAAAKLLEKKKKRATTADYDEFEIVFSDFLKKAFVGTDYYTHVLSITSDVEQNTTKVEYFTKEHSIDDIKNFLTN